MQQIEDNAVDVSRPWSESAAQVASQLNVNVAAGLRADDVTMLAFGQLAYVFNCRNLHGTSISIDTVRGNAAVWWAALSLVLLQCVFCYVPIMHVWFQSAAIGMQTWLLAIVGAIIIFLLVEAMKLIEWRR